MNDKQLLNDIEDMLRPQMGSQSSRKALVQSALWGCKVLDDIEWTGAAGPFTNHLVTTLLAHGDCQPGTPAIITLLEHARDQRGNNWISRYNDLITRVEQANIANTSTGAERVDNNPQLISFLVTTGIWAQTQLGEIWKLRRQQQTDKPPIELEDESTMEAEAPAELDVPSVKTDRATQLLEKMHKNIADWLDEKEDVDRLINLGTMDEIRGNRRKKDLDDKINTKLEEIPTAMARLGVKIDRE